MGALRIIALLLLVASALILFPISKASSSVFYISCAFLLLSVAIAKWEGKRNVRQALDYLGLLPRKEKLLSYLAWGALALAAACAATFAVSFVLLQFGLLDTQAVQDKVMSLPALSLILAIALSPIGEETFFRGFLFRKLSEQLSLLLKAKNKPSKQKNHRGSPLPFPPIPVLCSALMSSLLFALMHLGYGSFAELAVTFAVGLVFCAATYKSGSTIPAILAHCAFNLLSLSMYVCANTQCGF